MKPKVPRWGFETFQACWSWGVAPQTSQYPNFFCAAALSQRFTSSEMMEEHLVSLEAKSNVRSGEKIQIGDFCGALFLPTTVLLCLSCFVAFLAFLLFLCFLIFLLVLFFLLFWFSCSFWCSSFSAFLAVLFFAFLAVLLVLLFLPFLSFFLSCVFGFLCFPFCWRVRF